MLENMQSINVEIDNRLEGRKEAIRTVVRRIQPRGKHRERTIEYARRRETITSRTHARRRGILNAWAAVYR